MKSAVTIFLILISGSLSFLTAQPTEVNVDRDPKKQYKQQVGMNMAYLTASLFNQDIGDADLIMAMWRSGLAKNKVHLRLGLGGNLQNSIEESTTSSDIRTVTRGILGSFGVDFVVLKAKGLNTYIGLDGFYGTKNAKTKQTTTAGVQVDGFDIRSNYGFSPLIGLGFRAHERVEIRLESSIKWQSFETRQGFDTSLNEHQETRFAGVELNKVPQAALFVAFSF
jgi:hypothetical protein